MNDIGKRIRASIRRVRTSWKYDFRGGGGSYRVSEEGGTVLFDHWKQKISNVLRGHLTASRRESPPLLGHLQSLRLPSSDLSKTRTSGTNYLTSLVHFCKRKSDMLIFKHFNDNNFQLQKQKQKNMQVWIDWCIKTHGCAWVLFNEFQSYYFFFFWCHAFHHISLLPFFLTLWFRSVRGGTSRPGPNESYLGIKSKSLDWARPDPIIFLLAHAKKKKNK